MRAFYAAHKKRINWTAGFAAVGLLVWLFVMFFVTPYNHSIDRSEAFYVSTTELRSTSARATVLNIDGDKGQVRLEDGARKDSILEVTFYQMEPAPGDTVLIDVMRGGEISSGVVEYWRMPGVILLAVLFVLLVVIVAGRQGLMSVAGLVISICVIAFGLIPTVVNGANAFWACIASAFVIAIISIVVAHGWRYRTFVSLCSILLVLTLAILLALFGGWIGYLTGVYDETSANLLYASGPGIDLRGVLVGGIIIATLGVLDDIITAQTAAVDELHKAQPKLTFKQLFAHGRSVGGEHVASLVNTLALAYIGVSLPVVISMVIHFNPTRSIWALLNTEFISQEIIRTLVSSMALVLAIPIATAIASWAILHKAQIIAILKGRKHKSGGRHAAN